jgi:phage head maturation protease
MTTPLSVRKLTAAEVKSVDVENGTVTAVVSDESVDRDGDIIRAQGWQLDAFRALPVMLADHDYSIEKTIGRWRDLRIDGTSMIGTAEYFLDAGNDLAEKAFALAQRGLAAFSVGFKTYPEHTIRLDTGGNEYRKQELLEISQVAIPANPRALAFAKSIGEEWEEEDIDSVIEKDDNFFIGKVAHELYVTIDEHSVAMKDMMKDLSDETVRLERVMNMLMQSIVEINQHLDYMYQPNLDGGGDTEEDNGAKPKPDKPKPDRYRMMQYLESNIDKLMVQALKE